MKEEVKIAILEEQMKVANQDLREIKNNHLPHLQTRLDSIEKKMAYYLGIATAILSMVQIGIAFLK